MSPARIAIRGWALGDEGRIKRDLSALAALSNKANAHSHGLLRARRSQPCRPNRSGQVRKNSYQK